MRKAHVQLLGSIQSAFLYFFVLLICVFSLFVLTSDAAGETGAEISLAWDRNTEPDLKGYKIYYKTGASGQPYDGTGAHEGSSPITIYVNELQDSNAPSYKLTELLHGETYHLTLTAFNEDDVESEYSNEVSVTTNTLIVNHTPTANAGLDQTKTEGVTIILDGSNSSDPEENITSYKWQQTSGPSVNILNSNQAQAMFTAPDVGADGVSLMFELTVTDAVGLTDIDSCIVNVSWLNVAPTADAGVDQTVNEGETVTLSAQRSADEDDAVLNYKWSQANGPAVTIINDSSMEPYFTAPEVDERGASLTFNLLVTDGGGLTASDTCVVNVSWLNEAPIAFAGTDKVVTTGVGIILDGSGSSDPENSIEAYQWTQKSGPVVPLSNASSAMASFFVSENIADGSILCFELAVTDSGGLKAYDACSVEIKLSAQDSTDGQDSKNTNTDNNSNNGKNDTTKKDKNTNGTDTDDLTTEDPSPSIVVSGNNGKNNSQDASTGQEKELTNNKNTKNETPAMDQTKDEDVVDMTSSIDLGATDEHGGTGGTDEIDATDTTNNGDDEDKPTDDGSGDLSEVVETFENSAPYQPSSISPKNGLVVSVGLSLMADGFMDPDDGDAHLKTQWQIFEQGSGICVVNVTSSTYLTAIDVPEYILSEDTGYYWRARFFDDHGNASDWSMNADFFTAYSGKDTDGNGVPDIQDADITVDMDGDAVPDVEQAHIRTIVLPNSEQHIGLSIESCPNVEGIISMEAIEPENSTLDIEQEADVLPYGLINFKLDVCNAGDVATVTIFFEEPAPADAKWVKYDQIQALWIDYSDHATFSTDRMSIVLEFKDGGYGDDDGIENGIIVDPSGLEVISAAQTVQVEATGSDPVQSSSGGGGGCFIECTSAEAGSLPLPLRHSLALLLIFSCAFLSKTQNIIGEP